MAKKKDRQFGWDIAVKSIRIRKPEGQFLNVVPGEAAGRTIFANLTLTESIFQTGITGLLKLKEPGAVGDYFNLIGNETVEIIMKSPEPIDHEVTLNLCVTNVRFLGDEAQEAISGEMSRAGAGWELDIAACESYIMDTHILEYMDNDYIGKISDFVEENIADKYLNNDFNENDMEIEETHNSIWLKKNHMMYPWGKDVNPPNLLNLMNNICENSVTLDKMGVNYLFWQDFDGWHFKSVRKMIQDGKDTTWGFGLFGENPVRTYTITDKNLPWSEWPDGMGDPRIESFIMQSEYNHYESLQNGGYSSYYELIKPNYDDPYFDYLDFTTSHMKSGAENWGEREIVTYDYHDATEDWGGPDDGGRIEQFKLLPTPKEQEFDTEINLDGRGGVDKKTRRKYDENGLYGYFSSPYNVSEELNYSYMGSAQTEGKYGKSNNIMWQTMFDQTDLNGIYTEDGYEGSGFNIKTIQEEVKTPIRDNYKQYVNMKNVKEKWNVYKNSICCDKDSVEKYTFFAVIEDAVKIQDNGRSGIYEYTWREVEMWPKESIESYEGEVISPEEAPLTIVAVEGGMGSISEGPSYNVNELMNTDIGNDVFAGPGVNLADEDFNDYPEAFQMMPVGGYFLVGDDPCEVQDEGDHGVHFHKHIVQMYKIPSNVLESIVPSESEDEDVPSNIYLFDVPNAHDGLCSCP